MAFTRKQARLGLLAAGVAVAGFLSLVGVRYKEAVAQQRAFAHAPSSATARVDSTPYTLIAGERTRWQPRVALTGTLLPIRDASLSFKIMGRLASIHVKLGDRVRAGRKLATLDAAEAHAQLAAALAEVRSAELQRAFAEENQRRTSDLYGRAAVSESQLINDRQRSELASAQLEAARAQADAARSALDNTQLLAPFAGQVTEAPSAPGAIVTPGAVLFRIQDTSSLRLSATISPADAAFATPGARVELTNGAELGDRAAGRGGMITAVLPGVDSQTRRLPIIAEIPNGGDAPLLANIFVRATLVPSALIDVVKLPATALRSGSQDEIAIADGERVRIARIEYARADDGNLLVRSDLSADDRVLAAPSAQLKNGDPLVRVTQ